MHDGPLAIAQPKFPETLKVPNGLSLFVEVARIATIKAVVSQPARR